MVARAPRSKIDSKRFMSVASAEDKLISNILLPFEGASYELCVVTLCVNIESLRSRFRPARADLIDARRIVLGARADANCNAQEARRRRAPRTTMSKIECKVAARALQFSAAHSSRGVSRCSLITA